MKRRFLGASKSGHPFGMDGNLLLVLLFLFLIFLVLLLPLFFYNRKNIKTLQTETQQGLQPIKDFLTAGVDSLLPDSNLGISPLSQGTFSFADVSLPLFYRDDLWWTQLTVDNQQFPVLVDTGSSWLTLPNQSCSNCQGPPYLNVNTGSTSSLTYGGGQEVKFSLEPIYIQELGRSVEVSVIASGTNPNGQVKSVLGLLNPSLGLNSIILDFPGQQLILNPDLSNLTAGTPITTSRYIAVQIPPFQGLNSVVLDSGTNFVLSPVSFPNGFNFEAGQQKIYVPASIIRGYEINPLPNTVILGNKAMSQYRWSIDFRRKMVWAS